MPLTAQHETRLKQMVEGLVQRATEGNPGSAVDELYELTRMSDAELRAVIRAWLITRRSRVHNMQTQTTAHATNLQNESDTLDAEIGPDP